MSWKEVAEPVLTRMPVVARPEGHVPFKRKLTWTAGVLVVYFFLTNITLFGLDAGGSDLFGEFRSILAGGQGSVLQVGIGPIVTASIVLQLLGGANLLGLDTSDPRDQILYQGLQKLLVIIVTAATAAPMVFGGSYLPANPDVASAVGVGVGGLQLLIFAQVFVGGILILFMDEIVSKWGVGSGVGLFIIAGVSQQLIGGFFSWESLGTPGFFASWYGIIFGDVQLGPTFTGEWFQALLFDPGNVLALFTTLLIFVVVVYAESVRVEIPLSHSRVRGARGRFPVKLIYASVLPMILVRALQANIQFVGQILYGQMGDSMPAILGVYNGDGQPIDGLFYYLAPIQSIQDWMWFLGLTPSGIEPWQIGLRIAVDLTFMIIGGAIFAVFWVETTGMGPEATARQIQNSGMQIPGFRRNPQVVEKVMERYIPQVTVIGGALVGLLAVMANMLGTVGNVGGTG
ncbi:MAG: preprotein translocase subunit SecY, partial [Halohasta sp.]